MSLNKAIQGKVLGLVIQKIADSEPRTTLLGAALAALVAAKVDWGKVLSGDPQQMADAIAVPIIVVLAWFINHRKLTGLGVSTSPDAGKALSILVLCALVVPPLHAQGIPAGCRLNPDGVSYSCPLPTTQPPVASPSPSPANLPSSPPAVPVSSLPDAVPAVVVSELPPNFYATGVAWNQYARPQINGWASMAHLISSQGVGIYSYSTYDVTSRTTSPFTIQTSTRTGFAALVRQYGPVYIFGLGDAGVALSGTNVGGAFGGGGIGVIKLGKTNWCLMLGARVLRTALSPTQTIYEAGFGRSF